MDTEKPKPPSCDAILRVLGDATRLKVVELLFDGAKNVGELNAVLQVEATLLSHHLRVLREAGIVQGTREGKCVVYQLTPEITSRRSGKTLDFGCCTLCFSE